MTAKMTLILRPLQRRKFLLRKWKLGRRERRRAVEDLRDPLRKRNQRRGRAALCITSTTGRTPPRPRRSSPATRTTRTTGRARTSPRRAAVQRRERRTLSERAPALTKTTGAPARLSPARRRRRLQEGGGPRRSKPPR